MKKYIVDANVILRFLLKDNLRFYQKAKDYFLRAQKKRLLLILLPETILEVNYVLKGVYSIPKPKRVTILFTLVKSPDLEVENRIVLINSLENYQKINVDLADIYLWETAKEKKATVLSFDKDFRKLERNKV